jgi:von Willebrand factor type A domain
MVAQTVGAPERGKLTRVIGLAIDVSGSMEGSIQNAEGGQLSRLDAIRNAFDTVLSEAGELVGAVDSTDGPDIFFFSYAFGLRVPGADECADLFRLLSLRDEISPPTKQEVEEKYKEEISKQIAGLKDSYETRIRVDPRSVAVEVMGVSAIRLLQVERDEAESILRSEIEQKIRRDIERNIRELVKADMADRIRKRLGSDMTLSVADLREFWANLREGMSMSNELLGGSTPMCLALQLVEQRFIRERAKHQTVECKLFIVSDGEANDGDPRVIAKRIKSAGIDIMTCFVSDRDVIEARRLCETPNTGHWPNGATVMFDMASQLEAGSSEASYFEGSGWDAPVGAHLFTQINHSDLLNEFMRVIVSPINAERASLASTKASSVIAGSRADSDPPATAPSTADYRSSSMSATRAAPKRATPRTGPKQARVGESTGTANKLPSDAQPQKPSAQSPPNLPGKAEQDISQVGGGLISIWNFAADLTTGFFKLLALALRQPPRRH